MGYNFPKISGTYIAAVSGGPDSMAMLDMYINHISLVCHINYHKRQGASRDEEIVINYCKERNMPYKILHVTDEVYRKYSVHTKNFEAIARNIRYDFFRECIGTAGTNRLLVGHNLDDFIENAIMQRERNSKTLFYGIKQITEHHGLTIFRPFIDIRKAVLASYCNRVGVQYGIDETNASYEILRNRVRKCVELWPDVLFGTYLRVITKYNKRNARKIALVAQAYEHWKSSNFDIKVYRTIDNDLLPYVTYQYLIDNNLGHISGNKINSVIEYLFKSEGEKLLRLEEDTYIKLI